MDSTMFPVPANDNTKKALDGFSALEGIELSDKELDKLLLETVSESIVEKIPFVGEMLSSVQKYKDKIDAARTTILLKKFENKIQNHDKFTEAMTKLLTSNSGLTIFQRIIRILNRDIFDLEFIELLARTLKNISGSDIDKLFEEINYVLSQIENISSQAALLLSKYGIWYGVRLERATSMSGELIVGDWDMQIANFFSLKSSSKLDNKGIKRVAHCFKELEANGLIELSNATRTIELTQIGKEVFDQIS